MQFLTISFGHDGNTGGHGLRSPALITHPCFQSLISTHSENAIYFIFKCAPSNWDKSFGHWKQQKYKWSFMFKQEIYSCKAEAMGWGGSLTQAVHRGPSASGLCPSDLRRIKPVSLFRGLSAEGRGGQILRGAWSGDVELLLHN